MFMCFQVKEDLLPENHRGILVEQLNDILRQLQADPTKIPLVRFTPEEVMSPTRETRERNQSEEARVRMIFFKIINIILSFISFRREDL